MKIKIVALALVLCGLLLATPGQAATRPQQLFGGGIAFGGGIRITQSALTNSIMSTAYSIPSFEFRVFALLNSSFDLDLTVTPVPLELGGTLHWTFYWNVGDGRILTGLGGGVFKTEMFFGHLGAKFGYEHLFHDGLWGLQLIVMPFYHWSLLQSGERHLFGGGVRGHISLLFYFQRKKGQHS